LAVLRITFKKGHTPWNTGTLKETKESLEHEGIKVSESLIQKIINTDGQAVVEMMAEKDGLERWEEEVVPPETKAIVVSLDGVTVPLNEKGSAVPRPSSERPELGKKTLTKRKNLAFEWRWWEVFLFMERKP
jgi:hypothetical protein